MSRLSATPAVRLELVPKAASIMDMLAVPTDVAELAVGDSEVGSGHLSVLEAGTSDVRLLA